MMRMFATAALGGPVLEAPDAVDPFARCVAQAQAEADAEGFVSAAPGAHAQNVAVVAGVPCHRDEAIPSLSWSSRDAIRMAKMLQDAGYTVLPLVSDVTGADLEAALDRAAALVDPDGTLLVYFSGHGLLREEAGGLHRYLVLSDTDLGSVATTALSATLLDQRVSNIDAAARVLIQDTCFASRAGGKSIGLPAEEGVHGKGMPLLDPGQTLRSGDLRLYGSRFFEQAIERADLRGSVYTHHLLAAFAAPETADLDGDGCVGLLEGQTWARARTSEDRGGFQVPQQYGVDPQNLSIGCSGGSPTHAVVEGPPDERWRYSLTQHGERVDVFDTLATAPGRYRVEVVRTDGAGDGGEERLLAGPLHLRAGEWTDLTDEIARRRSRVELEATAQVAATEAAPGTALGLSGAFSARDRGAGRPWLGGSAATAIGPGSDPNVGYGSAEILGRTGMAWTLPLGTHRPLTVGPALGVGALWRTPFDRAGGPPLPTQVGPLGDGTLRTSLTLGRLGGSIDLGLRVIPVLRNGDLEAAVAPIARVGLGARL